MPERARPSNPSASKPMGGVFRALDDQNHVLPGALTRNSGMTSCDYGDGAASANGWSGVNL